MLRYDVVVVGAGPAGLMAAYKAAELGASVLVVEREGSLAVKPCAEGLSKQTLITAELEESSFFVCNEVKGAYVYPPDESKRVLLVEEGNEGFIVDKKRMLQVMAARAAEGGADLWMRSTVKDLLWNNGRVSGVVVEVEGNPVKVEASIVLGCDGVGSTVARKAGFNMKGYEIIPTMQYVMVNCKIEEQDKAHFYLGNEVAPKGYAWVFPKGDGIANVGIGVRGKPAKSYLDKFIKQHPDMFSKARIVEVKGAPVPIGGVVNELVKPGVAICGDAAGQVIPLTGGGIHSSIAAGKIAGELAARAVLEDAPQLMNEYPKLYQEPWGKRIYNSLKALRAIEALSDEELNKLAEIITGEDIVDLARGLNTRRVAMKFLKHPLFAMKLAKKLLS